MPHFERQQRPDPWLACCDRRMDVHRAVCRPPPGGNVVPTNEDGRRSRSNAMSRDPSRNQYQRNFETHRGPVDDIGRQVPGGNFLTTHFVVRPRTFTLLGSGKASSTRRRSRNGGRNSSNAAIDIRVPAEQFVAALTGQHDFDWLARRLSRVKNRDFGGLGQRRVPMPTQPRPGLLEVVGCYPAPRDGCCR